MQLFRGFRGLDLVRSKDQLETLILFEEFRHLLLILTLKVIKNYLIKISRLITNCFMLTIWSSRLSFSDSYYRRFNYFNLGIRLLRLIQFIICFLLLTLLSFLLSILLLFELVLLNICSSNSLLLLPAPLLQKLIRSEAIPQ